MYEYHRIKMLGHCVRVWSSCTVATSGRYPQTPAVEAQRQKNCGTGRQIAFGMHAITTCRAIMKNITV